LSNHHELSGKASAKPVDWFTLSKIPHVLLSCPQWVCWRYVDRGQGRKLDKQPVNPRTLANAGVHWANTWTGFEEAYATYLRHQSQTIHGIGFVLTQDDPYVAIDLDACLHKAQIERRAEQVVNDLGSYTEISSSGRGLRILLTCPDFHDNARRATIEIYTHSRYVTITGHHVAGTPTEIAAVSADLIASLLPATSKPISSTSRQPSKPKPLFVTQ
jgi:primase-polymerase (primpol)-like protein